MPRLMVFVPADMYQWLRINKDINRSRIFQKGVAMENIKKILADYTHGPMSIREGFYELILEQLDDKQKELLKEHVTKENTIVIDPSGVELLREMI